MAGGARALGVAPGGSGSSLVSGGPGDIGNNPAVQKLMARGGFMGTTVARLVAAARARKAPGDALLKAAPTTTPQTTSDAFVKARAASDRVRRQAGTLFGGTS
jgi:hypothetical protein